MSVLFADSYIQRILSYAAIIISNGDGGYVLAGFCENMCNSRPGYRYASIAEVPTGCLGVSYTWIDDSC